MPIIGYNLAFCVRKTWGNDGTKKRIVQVRSPLIDYISGLYFQPTRNFIGIRNPVDLYLGSAGFELNVPKFLYLTEKRNLAADFSQYGPEYIKYLLPELIGNSLINMIPTVEVVPGFDGPKYVLRLWLPFKSAFGKILAWYVNNHTWSLIEQDAYGFETAEEATRVLRGESSDCAEQLSFLDSICWGSCS